MLIILWVWLASVFMDMDYCMKIENVWWFFAPLWRCDVMKWLFILVYVDLVKWWKSISL